MFLLCNNELWWLLYKSCCMWHFYLPYKKINLVSLMTYCFLWNRPPYFLIMEYTLKSYFEPSPWSALCYLYANFPWGISNSHIPFFVFVKWASVAWQPDAKCFHTEESCRQTGFKETIKKHGEIATSWALCLQENNLYSWTLWISVFPYKM